MVSAVFTTFNRTTLLFEAVDPFLKDERITEIVISDDHSTEDVYAAIHERYEGTSKVKIFQNATNQDCYRNKKLAVERATSEWVFILDSDNIFSKEFIDSALLCKHIPNTILQPAFARPHFNFIPYAGTYYSIGNLPMQDGTFQTMLNACNYFVHREKYLEVWDGSVDPVTSDSLYQNYNWLKAGNYIFVVPGMEYDHRVHPGSHYQQNVRRTPQGFHENIMEKLKQLK